MIWNLIGTIGDKLLHIVDDVAEDQTRLISSSFKSKLNYWKAKAPS